MTLDFAAKIAGRDFDVQLTVRTGETIAILGPNGAGKSTLLDVIAGLVRPDSGRVVLDERVLFQLGGREIQARKTGRNDSRSPRAGHWVAPHERGVSMLAQDALLFPHLSVHDNVAFAPRSAGLGRSRANQIGASWLAEVEASDLADRRPAELSGGQAQRIAVARALAADPHLLLLDEPMAALDITVAPLIRRMLRRVLVGRSAIIVTHDILDALILADRVIIIENGRVVDQGQTRLVFSEPRSQFAADLCGLNLLTGIKTPFGLVGPLGVELTAESGSEIPIGTAVGAAIAPTAIRITRERTREDPLNGYRLEVRDLEPRGDVIRVRTDLLVADVPTLRVVDLDIEPEHSLWFSFLPAAPRLYAM